MVSLQRLFDGNVANALAYKMNLSTVISVFLDCLNVFPVGESVVNGYLAARDDSIPFRCNMRKADL